MKKIKYLGLAMLGTGLLMFSCRATTPSMSPPASKVDLLTQAAELERQAATKQATNIEEAKLLREQAKKMRDEADKIK